MSNDDREQRWRVALTKARESLDSVEHLDGSDDPETLRQSLIRTRLAAAVERQAHEARAVVVDIEPHGEGMRIVVCVPTGDRVELREVAADMMAAAYIGRQDVAILEAAMHRSLALGADAVRAAEKREQAIARYQAEGNVLPEWLR